MRLVTEPNEPTDEELLHAIAAGREDAVGPLYSRYAPIILGMAARALDRATAEEIVQDVFLSVWKKAATFDPARGLVRPWLLQIAHYRIANELRSRSRRPAIEPDRDGSQLAAVVDPMPDPTEAAWTEYRRAALLRALEQLPPPQRQALGLSYFQDLSHGEIARVLQVPLGTAKSRLRAGLQGLRVRLAPLIAGLAIVALLTGVALEVANRRRAFERDERALAMLTSSDSQSFRMTAAPGAPAEAHAVYRFREGSAIAVVTLSSLPTPPAGRAYQVWALLGERWTSVGVARTDAAGKARLVAEDPAFSARPAALEVTLEAAAGTSSPSGPVVVAWPAR